MSLLRLDHATINTVDLDASVEFYAKFLGLQPGWRPDFTTPGAWLYPEGGDYPILHLIARERNPEGGNYDHVAFRAENLPAYLAKVKASGTTYTAMPVKGTSLVQVQHRDPNNALIEVTFEGEEIDPAEIIESPVGVVRMA